MEKYQKLLSIISEKGIFICTNEFNDVMWRCKLLDYLLTRETLTLDLSIGRITYNLNYDIVRDEIWLLDDNNDVIFIIKKEKEGKKYNLKNGVIL